MLHHQARQFLQKTRNSTRRDELKKHSLAVHKVQAGIYKVYKIVLSGQGKPFGCRFKPTSVADLRARERISCSLQLV